MPNNIKNKITIEGSKEDADKFVKRFSTFHDRIVRKTHDDSAIICKETGGNFIGWYDENNNTFRYSKDRNTDKETKGLPDGIEYEYREAFIQMPDFEKVIPTPEILKGFEPHLEIINRCKNAIGYKTNSHDLISSLEKSNRVKDCFSDIKEKDIPLVIKGLQCFEETGFFYWYDWNNENWGTKWNSYSCDNPNDNSYVFETAWCGVPDLIKKMTEDFKDITINYLFADEDTGCNTGDMIISNGEIIDDKSPVNESNRAYEIYLEFHPDCEYIKMIDGKYQYVDEDDK